jgi:hypothetical protein
MPQDDQGRTLCNGYVITGDEEAGYRARAQVPLTEVEALYGVQEMLFAETLLDISVLTRQQLILRSQVGTAAGR